MHWSTLLQEKRNSLSLKEFIRWMYTSDEAQSIPYNPWLKHITHAIAEHKANARNHKTAT